ncbi:hypothetical protein LP419_06690 [Massilia sp. H-1]|nr:hypothetical protein LP419_06690 [Massilia sp. H-1]
MHQGSDETFPITLAWNADGTAENEWKIPATARQGTYRVMIGQTVAGSFHVEQFRVPTMRALLAGPKAAVVGEAKVDLDLQLSYLSGGGAAFAPVKVRTVVQPRGVSFSGYEGFSFTTGDVKEGVEKGDGYNEWDDECCDEEGAGAPVADAPVRQRPVTLDKAGGARGPRPGGRERTSARPGGRDVVRGRQRRNHDRIDPHSPVAVALRDRH